MYAVLNGLLADKKGEVVFKCFNIWHIIYLAVIFGAIALAIWLLWKKMRRETEAFPSTAIPERT